MNVKKLIVFGIIYAVILVSLNYLLYVIPLESNSQGIGEWTGTGQQMESEVIGPSFIVDYIGGESWKIIWIGIMIIPGIIIAYKFYKQIKLKSLNN